MIVDIQGVLYDSVKQAAEALNVSTSYIYTSMARGRTDTIGVGQGRGPRGRVKPKKPEAIGKFFTDPRRAAAFACRAPGRLPSESPDCSQIIFRETMIKQHFDATVRKF